MNLWRKCVDRWFSLNLRRLYLSELWTVSAELHIDGKVSVANLAAPASPLVYVPVLRMPVWTADTADLFRSPIFDRISLQREETGSRWWGTQTYYAEAGKDADA